MKDIWSTYAGKGVQVAAVAEGWSGTEADADAWLTGAGITFPAVFEPSPYPIGQSYGVSGVPRTFIIDKMMTIRYDFLGLTDCNTMKEALDQLVNEQSRVKFPKFVFSYGIPDRAIPRWMKVAYLTVSMRSERFFQDMDVRTGKRFDDVVSRHLNAYLKEGTMPPDGISTPILNLADEYMTGRAMSLRAGDYIALQNYILAGGK